MFGLPVSLTDGIYIRPALRNNRVQTTDDVRMHIAPLDHTSHLKPAVGEHLVNIVIEDFVGQPAHPDLEL